MSTATENRGNVEKALRDEIEDLQNLVRRQQKLIQEQLGTIDQLEQQVNSSRKRVKRCLETLPAQVNPHRIFFVDRQSFMDAGDDIKNLEWVRGDATVQTLPCWG